MSSHRKTHSSSSTGAFYQQLPQGPVPLDVHQDLSDSLILEDETILAGEFVAQEEAAAQDPRIRYMHFVLGCAVLLPWNGMSRSSGNTKAQPHIELY